MPKKFICKLSKSELENLYLNNHMTIKQLCDVVGCKSDITMAKILNENGIDTNENKRRAFSKRGNRTDAEFESFLRNEYLNKKRSMTSIAKELGISWVVVSRYFDKYNIQKRSKSEQQSGEYASNWKGGRRLTTSGYIEIYSPDHPNKNKRGCVYEHVLVAEKMICRYLEKGEVVHHIDMNKRNNSPDNLMVMKKEDHTKLHLANKTFGNHKKDFRKKVIVS